MTLELPQNALWLLARCTLHRAAPQASLPRDPVSLLMSPAASGYPAAARPATPTQPAAPQVDLSVVVWPRGPGHARHAWALKCPPMTAACRAAMRRSLALA